MREKLNYKNLNLEFVCTCEQQKIVEDFEEHGYRQGNSFKIWTHIKQHHNELFPCINDVSIKKFVDYYNQYAHDTKIRNDNKFLYVTDSGIEYLFKILN